MTSEADALSQSARNIYEQVKNLPIISPHGHCDPSWWANDTPFPDPATLLIVPDHYVFRMLYSLGVPLETLGVGVPAEKRNAREIFQTFANHWNCFLGTPSRKWIEYTLYETLGISCRLTKETSNQVFDEISDNLSKPEFRPRALFDDFKIELLATTDAAIDDLKHHHAIKNSDWAGRVIPTFRPDSILNPLHPEYQHAIRRLAEIENADVSDYYSFLGAIRNRREFFKSNGATATDHDVPILATTWLDAQEISTLHAKAISGRLTDKEAITYYGHMLIEMAQMSVEDKLVMQLHVGSQRNTNQQLFETIGPDVGTDIPTSVNWVNGLDALLNRVGNNPDLRVIAFTLDESTYARELAPMAGHWPCLRLGPPWWFHDSMNGIRRYLDQAVETAGYFNLAGFNDDTRAFLSIPARHDMWRMAVSVHLSEQIKNGRLGQEDANMLAQQLCYHLAKDAYRLASSEI